MQFNSCKYNSLSTRFGFSAARGVCEIFLFLVGVRLVSFGAVSLTRGDKQGTSDGMKTADEMLYVHFSNSKLSWTAGGPDRRQRTQNLLEKMFFFKLEDSLNIAYT